MFVNRLSIFDFTFHFEDGLKISTFDFAFRLLVATVGRSKLTGGERSEKCREQVEIAASKLKLP